MGTCRGSLWNHGAQFGNHRS